MKPITTGVLLMGDLSAEDLASLARQLEDWGYDYLRASSGFKHMCH